MGYSSFGSFLDAPFIMNIEVLQQLTKGLTLSSLGWPLCKADQRPSELFYKRLDQLGALLVKDNDRIQAYNAIAKGSRLAVARVRSMYTVKAGEKALLILDDSITPSFYRLA